METGVVISTELKRAFDGVVPFVVATSSSDGIPNITFMSKLFYVDKAHVALSHQFMNKTWKNILDHPVFLAFVTDPETLGMWKVQLQFVEQQHEGPIFEDMEMELMALTTPQNITFSLQSALICKILTVEQVFKVI